VLPSNEIKEPTFNSNQSTDKNAKGKRVKRKDKEPKVPAIEYAKGENWFDKECIDARRKTRSKLRKYRHSTEEADRLDYAIERRDYHKLIRKKKQT